MSVAGAKVNEAQSDEGDSSWLKNRIEDPETMAVARLRVVAVVRTSNGLRINEKTLLDMDVCLGQCCLGVATADVLQKNIFGLLRGCRSKNKEMDDWAAQLNVHSAMEQRG
jgi:hypothetical protein